MIEGCRPLTDAEVGRVLAGMGGRLGARDRCLFLLGTHLGYRISELLSLNLGDVVTPGGEVVGRVQVERRAMKGKKRSRTVVLDGTARAALAEWVPVLNALGGQAPDCPLFCASRGLGRMTYYGAAGMLRRAFRRAGLVPERRGELGTHAMRKTFARRVHEFYMGEAAAGEKVDPLRLTAKAMGHTSINSTDRYLSFETEDVDRSVLAQGGKP